MSRVANPSREQSDALLALPCRSLRGLLFRLLPSAMSRGGASRNVHAYRGVGVALESAREPGAPSRTTTTTATTTTSSTARQRQAATTPPKPQAQVQAPAPAAAAAPAPSKSRLSALHASPPLLIRRGNDTLRRGQLLGEGGFARVYSVEYSSSSSSSSSTTTTTFSSGVGGQGQRKAIKVVAKDQLKNSKARGKLFAEIKLHQIMTHPNVVRFEECFEDRDNVYMLLELCQSGVSAISFYT
jgi:hypothetical protein